MDETIELLIAEVSKEPVLWNYREKSYKNTKLTDSKWATVAASVGGLTGTEAKKKFKNIKDRYRKERQGKVIKTGSAGGTYIKESSWPYLQLCGFLDDVLPTRTTEDNLSTPEASSSIEEQRPEIIEDFQAPNSPIAESIDASSLLSDEEEENRRESSTSLKYKMKKSTSKMDSLLGIEQKKIKLMETICSKQKNPPPKTDSDPDAQFFQSLLPYVKELTPYEKLQVRMKIQQMVMDAFEVHLSTEVVVL